jgi:hypothetical protein
VRHETKLEARPPHCQSLTTHAAGCRLQATLDEAPPAEYKLYAIMCVWTQPLSFQYRPYDLANIFHQVCCLSNWARPAWCRMCHIASTM